MTQGVRTAFFILAAATLLLSTGWFLLTSYAPDGLESVAGKLGFAHRERPAASAPMAGYEVPFSRSAALRKAAAGLAGAVLCFLAAWAIGRYAARRDANLAPRSPRSLE